MVTVVETEWGAVARVRLAEDETISFEGFDPNDVERRARVFSTVYERCGGCELIEKGSIPLEVACQSRAAIAAYLYSAHRCGIVEVAHKMGVEPGTIRQYISDILQGRR